MSRWYFFSLFTVIIFIGCKSNNEKTAKHEFSDWRGPNRNGIYKGNNLLKQWPENGPDLLWSYEGLGYGHSSAAVTSDRIFVTGIKDTIASLGTLFAFDVSGNLLWEKEYGPDFTASFHGTRSTPVVVDSLIYIESGVGKIFCLNTETGNQVWSTDFIKDFGVDSVIQFGFAESVLIDGDHLICVPGGKENNVVALNRFTGEKVWSCEGNKEIATYSSPILIDYRGHKLVIAMTASSILGIDAQTGEKYWRVEHTQQNNIHANTPIYFDGKIVVASADPTETSGMVQLELSDDCRSVKEVWRNRKLRSFMGGLIRIDTCIYSSAYLKNDWEVLSWNTGKMLVQNKDFGGGAIIYADGLFYCYPEHDGVIALADAAPDHFNFISHFDVPLGESEHWAHPVISDGKLIVRHGNALMVYDISAK